jgi:soluble lytic murein transglycosylase
MGINYKIPNKSALLLLFSLIGTSWSVAASALVSDHSMAAKDDDGRAIRLFAVDISNQKSPDTLEQVINLDDEKLSKQRQQFRQAERALHRHHLITFRRIMTKLEDYPLYPYLRYEYLSRRISRASSKELTKFFSEFGSQPVSTMLQSKLLRYLARRGQWKRFLQFYTSQESNQLECDYHYALIRTGQTGNLSAAIKTLWLTGKSQPRSCDRVFKYWQTTDILTPELVWQRIELALANGHRSLSRYLSRSLPAKDRKLAILWIKLYRRPSLLAKYQARLANNPHVMTPKILSSVFKRLALKDPQKAIDLWHKTELHQHISTEEQYDIMQTLAVSLARKHMAGAEEWFAQIPNQYLSDIAREWRVRSALRESRWEQALTAMNTLSPEQRQKDRWRYWRARVFEKVGLETTALTEYFALAKKRSYYGFLAADRVNQPYAIIDHPHQPTATELFSMSQRAGIKRAHEFYRLGRIVQARREWHQVMDSLNNDERIDASKLAQFWGWAEQSILTMASTDKRDDISLRFPLLFQQQVIAHSEHEDIDPAWTYGVIRRESAFMKDARSSKGAVGLMQLMPATAKRLSRSIRKVRYRNPRQLTHTDTNLALGTHYLRNMLKRFGGRTVLATAAYNAGEHRIDRWLPDAKELDAERWIENIPYRETREYVKSVLAFTVIYADRLGLNEPRLTERMHIIPSREALRSDGNI